MITRTSDPSPPTIVTVSETPALTREPRFSPVIALIAVSASWEGRLSAALRDLGLSTRKFGLLGHIGSEPGISFSELARRSHITVQSAHTAVRTLVDEGLVADATAHAGSASDLRITPKGIAVMEQAHQRLLELDATLSDNMPGLAASMDGIRAGIV